MAEFEASLVYRVNSRTAKDYTEKPHLEKQTTKRKTTAQKDSQATSKKKKPQRCQDLLI